MFLSPNSILHLEDAATMGFASYLLSSTPRAHLSLVSIQHWLRVPIRLDQILMVFNDNGLPEGYITWAYVTPETAVRLGDGSGRPPLPEDWNDGTLLWIVDIVAPFGQLAAVAKAARRHFAAHHNCFAYASRRNGLMRTRSRPHAQG